VSCHLSEPNATLQRCPRRHGHPGVGHSCPDDRARPCRARQGKAGWGGGPLTASARSMITVTFSSSCSLMVLVQSNWNTRCSGNMCLTAWMTYSVSSSVSLEQHQHAQQQQQQLQSAAQPASKQAVSSSNHTAQHQPATPIAYCTVNIAKLYWSPG